MRMRKFQSIYDMGDRITRNPCKKCKKVPSLKKVNNLWYVECEVCGARSPSAKFAYKAVFAWNKSKKSVTPYFLDLKFFKDCLNIYQAERQLRKRERELNLKWKQFMSDPRNKARRSRKRTYLCLLREQIQYYKWLIDYWKKDRKIKVYKPVFLDSLKMKVR